MLQFGKIIIKLKSYDHRLLESTVREIVGAAERTNARVKGPIPLPTEIRRWTVLRSPHTDKKSMETFELRVHKRLIHILDPQPATIEELRKIDVPPGIHIEMKVE
jgi:small subunit ribosomal protein S10